MRGTQKARLYRAKEGCAELSIATLVTLLSRDESFRSSLLHFEYTKVSSLTLVNPVPRVGEQEGANRQLVACRHVVDSNQLFQRAPFFFSQEMLCHWACGMLHALNVLYIAIVSTELYMFMMLER